MHPALETLEQHGIATERDCLRIESLPTKKASVLYSAIYDAVLDFQRKQLTSQLRSAPAMDPFAFIASASLRSDSGCWEVPCRLKKLDFLGRYAALYANEITIPLPLVRPSAQSGSDHARVLLRNAALTLTRLRLLIDAGLVSPVVMRSFHCPHTIEWVNEMMEVVHAFTDYAAEDLSKEFRVIYQLPTTAPAGRSTAYITGPEDFLEHGEVVLTFDEGPHWKAKSWRFDADGKTELRGRKKLWFVSRIFNEIANDTTFYLAYGRIKRARYLTDLRGEAFLLDGSTQDEELATTSNVLNSFLTHSVPLLGDLSIATLLRIRREERDSFMRYRAALDRILQDVAKRKKHIGKREAREMYKELIEPELLGMRSELYQEQKRQRRRVIAGFGTLAATVALGMFGGIVPLLVKGSLAAAGAMVGGRLLSKAAEAQCEHGATLKEKNDFYFLLRLTQEAAPN